MIRNIMKYRGLLVFLLLTGGPALSFPQEGDVTLSFPEVLKGGMNSSAYMSALQNYEKSQRETEAARHPGDGEITLQPGYKTQYIQDGTAGQTDITLSTGIGFYLGRSLLQEEKYRTALRDQQSERLSLNESRGEVILSLYTLYSQLWLLQGEETLLRGERSLAEERYAGKLQLYESGAATLMEVEEARDVYQLAEDDLNGNLLDQRLTWFGLEQERGLIGKSEKGEIPRLEDFIIETEMADKPLTLTERVLETSAIYAGQQNTLTALEETVKRLERLDWNLIIKPFASYGDHDWTVTYNWESRNLDLGYDFPLAELNSTSNQSSADTWTTGASLILTLGTNRADQLERDVLAAERRRQEELLKTQRDKLSLELRSLYQKLLQSEISLGQAEAALERQVNLKESVVTRYQAGQALKSDVTSAELGEQRSQWKKEGARIANQQAYMALMVLLGDLSFLGTEGRGILP